MGSWFRDRPSSWDLAQLTFLDRSAIHCFIRAEAESGHPVVLMNASRAVRRVLDLSGLDRGQLIPACSRVRGRPGLIGSSKLAPQVRST